MLTVEECKQHANSVLDGIGLGGGQWVIDRMRGQIVHRYMVDVNSGGRNATGQLAFVHDEALHGDYFMRQAISNRCYAMAEDLGFSGVDTSAIDQ